ncbi:hyalin-like [Diadema setosum]|uniref:hyalin-like n=1 Tax=Diadema setosum TaxID=31175 RepID=UPI003B3BB59C
MFVLKSITRWGETGDLESPNITCPADITQSTDPGLYSANVTWSDPYSTDPGLYSASVTWSNPYVTDNSGVFAVTSSFSSGSIFPAGNTAVSITAEDSSGNEATCNFTITIVDMESPNISCPADITQSTDPGEFSASVTWSDPYVTDNSGVFTIISTSSSGSIFPAGNTTISITAEDSSGNEATCNFTITVIDMESPNISCPADITQSTDPGLYSANVTWSDPYVTDNSGVFTVTSTSSSGNLESPNISCPADITQSTDPGEFNANVTWSDPYVTDNSGVFTITSTSSSGSTFPAGNTTISITAEDSSGNEATCNFTVTVVDLESPNISCPADITQPTDQGLYSANVTWSDPYVTDNSGVFTITSTSSSGSIFPAGNTTISITAEDPSGNEATCNFTITVVDLESPNISCPADITQPTDPGLYSANVTWSDPYVTDNSGVFTITSTSSSGSIFPAGNTTISITAEDPSGNEATCNFTITVVDLESPNISCPADITQSTDPGLFSANVTWSDPYVTDNSGVFTVTSTSSSGTVFPAGNTTVSITAEDFSGNEATCNFTITVIDLESPNISCPADITQPTDPGLFSANVTWSDPYVTDNSGAFTITSTSSSGSVFPAGNTTVSITAEDFSGNEATCNFTITVIDLESPNISCPADITQPTDPGLFSANVTWSDPYVTDNSGAFTITSASSSGNLESPNISCPADITQPTDPGLFSANVTWSDPYTSHSLQTRDSSAQTSRGLTPT